MEREAQLKRDVAGLESGIFDLLVVGGGIYGAWTAYHAARRGLRTALVESHDWASSTSSASSKLIHGGLRYLEQYRFGMVRKSLREKRRLQQMAPHRVRPLPFLVPIYDDTRVGAARLGLGLWVYDLLEGRTRFPRQVSLDRAALLRRYPHLRADHLQQGFVYEDAQTDDALFALEIVDGANEAGAVVANRVEVTDLNGGRATDRVTELDGDRLPHRISCLDRVEDRRFEVRARAVVDTRGPWVGDGRVGPAIETRRIKGVHLVLPSLSSEDALLVLARSDSRIIFILPWYGRTLVGTTDSDYEGDPRATEALDGDIDYLLREANAVLGDVHWKREDVISTFAGVRTLRLDSGLASEASREWEWSSPRPGLWTSVGGKYTSARADALTLSAEVASFLQLRGSRDSDRGPRTRLSETGSDRFPWKPEEPWESWRATAIRSGLEAGFDAETAESIADRYAARAPELWEMVRRDPTLRERIHPQLPFALAEVPFAVQKTMALSSDDILRRRTPVALLARIDESSLQRVERAARGVGGFSWPPSRRQ